MDRTEASIAPPRGAARKEDRATPPGTRRPARVVSGSLAATVCVLAILCCFATACYVAAPAAAAPSVSTSSLSLMAPPGFVTPEQPFRARLSFADGLEASSLDLKVTVYQALSTRSAFDETLGGTPVGSAISSSAPLSVASLAPDGPRGADLTVPVEADGSTTPGSGPFTADLECTQRCAGVYPLRIQLSEAGSSSVLAQLLTYLVFTSPDNAQRLRFALVVPVSVPERVPSQTGVLGRPSSSALAKLDSLLSVLTLPATHVPVTLAPNPATMSSLAADDTSRAQEALRLMSTAAGSSGREILCGPFASVDAGQLVSAGLASELSYQVQEGESVLEGSPLRLSCPTPRGIWVSAGALDQSALSALGALGYQDVVVPPSAVAGSPPSATWTQPLELGDDRADSLLAKTVDPVLSAHLQPAARADPALAADQVLAELELIYYEYPADVRGVVAVAPSSWGNTTFVTDLLSGLDGNPMVSPVTLADLFSQVPPGGTPGAVSSQPSSRRPAGDGSTNGLPANDIRLARSRVQGFARAVSQTAAGMFEAQRLDQLLLAAEAISLSPKQHAAAVSGASAALSEQLRALSVSAGSIRLTSNAAPVPITVVKNLPYPVTGILGLTSDKLVFPQGSQSPGAACRAPEVKSSAGRSSFSSLCVIDHSTNVVYVDMRSRASGDFRISVTLTSPSGSLVLASGQVTVRSMSTSAVAIALSVLAALVLLAWWARTVLRSRRDRRDGRLPGKRRPAHTRGTGAET